MQGGSSAREGKTARSGTGREFTIQGLFFENGSIFIISEGAPRIGAISASISTPGTTKVNTAKVIPSKYDSMFINNVSEKVASMTNGICLVSLYSKTALQLDDMKAIMEVVMDTIDRNKGDEQKRQQHTS
jgi:hypothetical protein